MPVTLELTADEAKALQAFQAAARGLKDIETATAALVAQGKSAKEAQEEFGKSATRAWKAGLSDLERYGQKLAEIQRLAEKGVSPEVAARAKAAAGESFEEKQAGEAAKAARESNRIAREAATEREKAEADKRRAMELTRGSEEQLAAAAQRTWEQTRTVQERATTQYKQRLLQQFPAVPQLGPAAERAFQIRGGTFQARAAGTARDQAITIQRLYSSIAGHEKAIAALFSKEELKKQLDAAGISATEAEIEKLTHDIHELGGGKPEEGYGPAMQRRIRALRFETISQVPSQFGVAGSGRPLLSGPVMTTTERPAADVARQQQADVLEEGMKKQMADAAEMRAIVTRERAELAAAKAAAKAAEAAEATAAPPEPRGIPEGPPPVQAPPAVPSEVTAVPGAAPGAGDAVAKAQEQVKQAETNLRRARIQRGSSAPLPDLYKAFDEARQRLREAKARAATAPPRTAAMPAGSSVAAMLGALLTAGMPGTPMAELRKKLEGMLPEADRPRPAVPKAPPRVRTPEEMAPLEVRGPIKPPEEVGSEFQPMPLPAGAAGGQGPQATDLSRAAKDLSEAARTFRGTLGMLASLVPQRSPTLGNVALDV